MSSKDGEVYIMSDDDEEGWVSPTPASTVISDAVTEQTDLDPTDLDEIESYVDTAELRDLLTGAGDGTVTFTVEEYEVTVDADGDVDIGP